MRAAAVRERAYGATGLRRCADAMWQQMLMGRQRHCRAPFDDPRLVVEPAGEETEAVVTVEVLEEAREAEPMAVSMGVMAAMAVTMEAAVAEALAVARLEVAVAAEAHSPGRGAAAKGGVGRGKAETVVGKEAELAGPLETVQLAETAATAVTMEVAATAVATVGPMAARAPQSPGRAPER